MPVGRPLDGRGRATEQDRPEKTAPNDKISPLSLRNCSFEAITMSGANSNLKNYDERIMRDRGICGGEPVFKDTRVTLRTVLASLASGDSVEDILSDFPSLKAEDVQAAIAFAAASAEEDLPIPAAPHIR
jgi:uncharacterized protein (DUF433 family)